MLCTRKNGTIESERERERERERKRKNNLAMQKLPVSEPTLPILQRQLLPRGFAKLVGRVEQKLTL